MKSISEQQIEQLSFTTLINALKEGFGQNYVVPERHHYGYDSGIGEEESTLLLMPAWRTGKYIGIKVVTVSPHNGAENLPAINGTYLLLDAKTGIPVAVFDAKKLTTKRTAAASALASSYLSRKNSSTLLMVGTGALAPELIKAHAAVRPINKVLVWGRNEAKAKGLASSLNDEAFSVEAVSSIQKGLEVADIVSCATLSKTPLVLGAEVKVGTHIDLVGVY